MRRVPRAPPTLMKVLTPGPMRALVPTPRILSTPGPMRVLVPTPRILSTPGPMRVLVPTLEMLPIPGPTIVLVSPQETLQMLGPTLDPTVVTVTTRTTEKWMTLSCTLLHCMQVLHLMISWVLFSSLGPQ
jgi:hypothetical protein